MIREAMSYANVGSQTNRSEFRAGSNCKLYSSSEGLMNGGISQWVYRDGSHVSKKDSTGFRPPTPYYGGYLYCETMPRGVIATKGPCPTWKNQPAVLGVAQLYRYPAHLLKAPDISDANPVILRLKEFGLTQAMSRVNLSDFNLGVALGERAQTYRLVRDTVLEFTHFVRDLRKGRIGPITRRLRTTDPFKLWLSYRYGWRQLYNDILGLLERVEDLGVQGKGSRVYTKSYIEVPFSTAGLSTLTSYAGVNSTITGVAFCKTRLDFVIENPQRFLLNQFGIDPSVVVWELLPWSFVLDWFLNVGNFLEAIAYVGGLDYLGGTQTVGCKYSEQVKITSGTSWTVNGSIKSLGFRFDRQLVNYPVPKLALNPYAISGQFSATRIADAISLAKAAISGSFKPPR